MQNNMTDTTTPTQIAILYREAGPDMAGLTPTLVRIGERVLAYPAGVSLLADDAIEYAGRRYVFSRALGKRPAGGTFELGALYRREAPGILEQPAAGAPSSSLGDLREPSAVAGLGPGYHIRSAGRSGRRSRCTDCAKCGFYRHGRCANPRKVRA